MRTTNRGDVPARHVPPSQAKGVAEDVDDVVFDAGSLSFVQDWVVDGGDTSAAAAAAAEVEPRREDPRKTNPNRRLGVGAQPKKPKQDRPEPSALEKKMLRKRQRQELSDAIAGEMDTHGVVDDKEGDGESKTASFKQKKERSKQQEERNCTAPAPANHAGTAAEDTKSRKKNGTVGAVVGSGDGNSGGSGAGDADGDGEKPGGKRKARRKKKKSAVPEVATGEANAAAAAVAVETPDKNSAAVVEETSPMAAVEAEAGGGGKVAEAAEPLESKKQRRGWGKARSKSAGAAANTDENVSQAKDAGGRSGRTDEHRPRKKTRSRQKNIRKDKRPADERPAYLRAGDPEFSGRGLTEETRKFLGLPQDDFGDAPPSGWGKPGKVGPTASWVIDKKPRRLPKHLEPDAGDEGTNAATTSAAAYTDARRKLTPAAPDATPSSTGKSKYKNLSLTPGGKTSANTKKRAKGGHSPGGTGGVRSKTWEKNDTNGQDGV